MQVIITMAGEGERFAKAGFLTPKPLIQIAGKPMVQHLIDIFPIEWKIYLACSKLIFDHLDNEKTIKNKNCKLIQIDSTKRGPLDTVLQTLNSIARESTFKLSEETIVSYCDYSMVWNPQEFLNFMSAMKADVGVIAIKGTHPTYLGPNTYCHLLVDEKNHLILDLKEKELYGDCIANEWTSIGFYYFRTISLLKEALNRQIEQDLRYQGKEYYTSLAIKALMNKSPELKCVNFPVQRFMQFGTPYDLERIDYWWKCWCAQSHMSYNFKSIPTHQQPTQLDVESLKIERQYMFDFFNQ